MYFSEIYASVLKHVDVSAASLPSGKCPHAGRYTTKQLQVGSDVKRRSTVETSTSQSERCIDQISFSSVSVGCSSQEDTVEFQSACPDEQNTGNLYSAL